MKSVTSSALGALLIAIGLAVGPLPTTLAAGIGDDPEVKVLNKSQVYHPSVVKKGAKYKKPATLETSKVFDEIKEWKEIKRKKLTSKDAEYHLLLKAANDRFGKALKKVQTDGSFDIIAEKGAIKCKNCKADDVTKKTIDALPKK